MEGRPVGPQPVETDRPVTELGEFLRSRRDRITPDEAGVSSYGRRRVPGLRREELARLAGVSVTYLTRLEQGQSQNASEAIIDALARALRLDADERAHLYSLAQPAPARRPRTAEPEVAKPGAEQLLHSMREVPAVLLGRFNDILAWNRAGYLLLAGHRDRDAPSRVEDRPNQLKLLFLDEHTRDLYADWPDEAALAVASLRYVAAQFADDRRLAELVGELTMNSPEFARLWAGHDVRLCTSGTKRFRHPEVGELELGYEVLHLPEGNGQRIITHTAEAGSASFAALRLLGSASSRSR
ncbi:helix-turn-helix transcriptional regulator [Pseudonocardia parietis]|uniref:Transcriptional regulator with XRE-family HTH domain n=1 Tax=Pseudonocardia parietis TaxID=570936 RepID=A0ABS4VX31_9PSEU|nr:helix-turn-helix transcriptional regulator [Pseudonocardia parietis]MBP2368464.1 transcriptional regulator with XRE-family HTH domain [Pseudonocardia parietis]